MGHWIGIDVGKAFHWASVLDDEGREVLSRKVLAAEEDIEAFRSQVGALGVERAFFCVDMMGGPATLLEAVLQGHGERVFYLSGTALDRARDAYRGGEHKSDPRDARVIADQLRMRWRSLPETNPRDESSAEMRALLAHRRDLVQDQVRRITRMRGLLTETFPGLEVILDLTKDGALVAVAKVATPKAARRLGEARLARWLKAKGVRKAEELAQRIVEAAKAQRQELPAAELKAELVAEIASEVLRASVNRSWSSGRSAFPTVAAPAFSDEPPDDDDHIGEGHPEIDDPPTPLGTPHQLLVGVVPGIRALDGLIANDKFCMSRHARLLLSYSRRRQNPTRRQTDETTNARTYPPAGTTRHGGNDETSVARTQGSDGTTGRPGSLGPGLPGHPAVEPRKRAEP